MDWLVTGMIAAGSILMAVNIRRYYLFTKRMVQAGVMDSDSPVLIAPFVLLMLFLIGYIMVGFTGNPTFLIGAILFGGSVFVYLALQLIMFIERRVHSNEDRLRALNEELSDSLEQIRHSEMLKEALEKAEAASAAKTAFLSNMSHDIRTPMNAIIGFNKLAQETDDPAVIKSYLQKIGSSGEHLLELIDDILEMSRIESGRMELREEPANLHDILQEIHQLFSIQMQEKHITFEVVDRAEGNCCVMCDRSRLHRVMLNLLSNACKFTPEGGHVTVELSTPSPEDADHIETEEGVRCFRILVRDNGIGMKQEFAERVFDAFERERSSTVSGIQGTGLGMAITKNIVDMMQGTIRVSTAPGEGTEFVVTLPLRVLSDEEKEQYRCGRAQEKCNVDFSGRHLLLVDDMAVNREIGVLLLEQMGFTVDCAPEGRTAVNMIRTSPAGNYAAVLMDIQMPVMDGYEASRQIRALDDPDKAGIPIVAMSANAFAEDVQASLRAGMNDHVAKPIDVDKLKKALSGVLQ